VDFLLERREAHPQRLSGYTRRSASRHSPSFKNSFLARYNAANVNELPFFGR
jgi:hypothetical protein